MVASPSASAEGPSFSGAAVAISVSSSGITLGTAATIAPRAVLPTGWPFVTKRSALGRVVERAVPCRAVPCRTVQCSGMTSTDFELLHAWRGGDTRAGNELVERHFRCVYRFFRSKVDMQLDDLVQRTFLACLEAVDGFRRESAFRTFVLGIARYQLLRHYEADARARGRDAAELSVQQLAERSPNAVSAIARGQEHRILLAALRMLPLDLQVTVELYYWERMPLVDIAGVLQIPEGTVKSRLARARDRLRDHVESLARAAQIPEGTFEDLGAWASALREDLDRG